MAAPDSSPSLRVGLMAGALLVVLPGLYLMSFALLIFADGAGWVGSSTADVLYETLYAPIILYCDDDRPGVELLITADVWIYAMGEACQR